MESRSFSIANNSCPFSLFTQSLPFFSPFFFFSGSRGVGAYVCMNMCFIANASRKVIILSTIQLTCIRVGHWCSKPDYSFHQIHMSIQAATYFSGVSKASLWKYLCRYILQSKRSRIPMLDGDPPSWLALLKIKTEMKFIGTSCTHVFYVSFHYIQNNCTFWFPMHVIHT